ncbi:MAG: hypothetical protein D6698_06620, partial [Gammaproteobacteria bacterium]
FQDTDADDVLDVGSEVTIGNVPAGLTPVMTLSNGDTVATLTFTGNATNHKDADDVSDLTFVFDNTAFTSGDASIVANSGSGGAYSTNVGIDFRNPTSGGGGASVPPVTSTQPTIDIIEPVALQTVDAGSVLDIDWTIGGLGINTVDLTYSPDNGVTTEIIAMNLSSVGPYSWNVPSDLSGLIEIQAQAKDSGGAGLATDTVEIEIVSLELVGQEPSTLTPEEIEAGITLDEAGRKVAPGTGVFGSSPITGETEEISSVLPGWYIRSYNNPTVYYVQEGSLIRRPFWDATTFMTWADSWSEVIWVTDATLPTLTLGQPMLPQPGVALVKVQSDPRVYWVEEDADGSYLLRHIANESVASQIFGSAWADYIIDVSVGIFSHYTVGEDITFAESLDTSRLETRAEIASQVAG